MYFKFYLYMSCWVHGTKFFILKYVISSFWLFYSVVHYYGIFSEHSEILCLLAIISRILTINITLYRFYLHRIFTCFGMCIMYMCKCICGRACVYVCMWCAESRGEHWCPAVSHFTVFHWDLSSTNAQYFAVKLPDQQAPVIFMSTLCMNYVHAWP